MNTRPLLTCAGKCLPTPTAFGHRTAGGPAQTRWWKAALRHVVFAALRLHEYRYLRTRLFHEALDRDNRDCGVGTEPAQTTNRQ
jgi:hypothetical protein